MQEVIRYALNLAEDGHILSATFEEHAPKNACIVDELPEGDITDYKYIDGKYVYEPNVEKEIAEAESEIAALKSQLDSTDYKAIKYAEGWLTEEEYAPIKAERQALRDRINELETQIAEIKNTEGAKAE